MSICDLLMGTKKIFHIFAILFYEKSCKKIYPSKQLNIVNSDGFTSCKPDCRCIFKIDIVFLISLVTFSKFSQHFQPSVAFRTKTRDLICSVYQMFYIKCNIGLEWVNLPLKCSSKLMGSTEVTITHMI